LERDVQTALECAISDALIRLRGRAMMKHRGGINGMIRIDASNVRQQRDGTYAGTLMLSLDRLSREREGYLAFPRDVMRAVSPTIAGLAAQSLIQGFIVDVHEQRCAVEEPVDDGRALTLKVELPIRAFPFV
jgi:hypothetical protein